MDNPNPPTTHLSRNHDTHSSTRFQLHFQDCASQCRHFSPVDPQYCLVSSAQVVPLHIFLPRRRCLSSQALKKSTTKARFFSGRGPPGPTCIIIRGRGQSRSDLQARSSERILCGHRNIERSWYIPILTTPSLCSGLSQGSDRPSSTRFTPRHLFRIYGFTIPSFVFSARPYCLTAEDSQHFVAWIWIFV